MIDEAYAEYMANCRRFMRTINAHQVMDFGRNKPKGKDKMKNSKGERQWKEHTKNVKRSVVIADTIFEKAKSQTLSVIAR